MTASINPISSNSIAKVSFAGQKGGNVQFSGANDSFIRQVPKATNNFSIPFITPLFNSCIAAPLGAISGFLGSIPLLGTIWNYTGALALRLIGIG